MKRLAILAMALAASWAARGAGQNVNAAEGNVMTIETPALVFRLWPERGRYEIRDKRGRGTWQSNPHQPRFGEVTLEVGGKPRRVDLASCEARQRDRVLELTCHPLEEQPEAALRVIIRPVVDDSTLEFRYEAEPALAVQSIRLLDDALGVTATECGYAVVPVREGLLVPADSGRAFTHSFDTYAYEGCHMAMLGVVKNGAAALITWDDPYVAAEVRSVLAEPQILTLSLVLRETAKSFRVRFLGPGDYVTIGRAYRGVAAERGLVVPWREKLKGHPERSKLFGAVNFKLWSVLSRRMNEESTVEESATVNWTFEEAAQVAEHLKNDLELERVLFTLGGWIHRGYDNQHPDILPAAPECGGNDGLAGCARRVRQLGYLFCLHDNYQDMYRDAPSWDEHYLMKRPDRSPVPGGRWAGGRAWLTCSAKAVELAKRPQNLPAVKQLTDADAYFIDTTYAAGLMECFDPEHPLRRADDLRWKQAISDYARGVFGIFGSECGREWAIPHSDFFEGLTGVAGRNYHDENLERALGGAVVPLFEIVYRDCIAMYGKYGYYPDRAAAYVLQQMVLGRPLNYHYVPPHLYWQTGPRDAEPLEVRPAVAELEPTGPRQFRIRYRWTVGKTPRADWRVFVHFTDPAGAIKFQNDHDPAPPTSKWKEGEVSQGPFTVDVPPGLSGDFDIRIGLFDPASGARALLRGIHDGEIRWVIGWMKISSDKIDWQPVTPAEETGGDPALFSRADGGWSEGRHILDRFIKNTYEVLSPLNELTAELLLTRHRFLAAPEAGQNILSGVQRSVFGDGADSVEVIVNAGKGDYRHRARSGEEVLLPPYGFLIESPTFVAFHACNWNGIEYEAPPLFTLRSLDGRPLARSRQVRVYHGFGDDRIRLGPANHQVRRESVISAVR